MEVLAGGGNALDAAIAVNLTLGVVTPYLCGYGGDLFAIIWKDGAHAYNGSGRAPAAATPESVRRATGLDDMPLFGPQSVTVPGAVEAWFRLLERFGTRSFADLAARAHAYAADGFVPTERAATFVQRSRAVYRDEDVWNRVYGGFRAGERFRQPALARTISTLGEAGPGAYYRGPIADAIASTLHDRGSAMTRDDLASHEGEWVETLRGRFRDVEILEMPPNTQGIAALEALRIVDRAGPPESEDVERQHLLIEATKLALADRDAYVTDAAAMTIDPATLLGNEFIDKRVAAIDRAKASSPEPGRPAIGGTAYMCAADADGMCVSLIQSNYVGFGSGVHVADWGINLQNRGGYFSLDPDHVNVIAPRKRTMHTLIPALALRDGVPWLVFGSMGGDGQAQTHVQLLTKIVDDGIDLQEAIDAPRWVVSPGDWSVSVETPIGGDVVAGLRAKGHDVREVGALDSMMGHAHAIRVDDGGYAAATDPRTEGAALGL